MPVWHTPWSKLDVYNLWDILKSEPKLSGLLVTV